MRIFWLFVLLSVSLSLGFADAYQTGNRYCEGDGFQEAERDYKARPDSISVRLGYAHCLFARGKDGDHQEALRMVQPSGAKTFVVNYRSGSGGRSAPNKRVTLGRFGRITPEQARRMAQELLGKVASGEDPAQERAEARDMPTLARAFEDYMSANPRRKPRTVEMYRQNLRVCFGDWLTR